MVNSFLYQEIYEKIREQIKRDYAKEGALIPTENELMEIYGVSRNTIRKAVQQLVEEGRLKKIRGRGTIVTNITKHKKSIGLIVPDIIHTFFTKITRGVEDTALQHGYSVILCNSDNNTLKERNYLDELKERVCGFIIAPATGNQNYDHYGDLIQKRIPFIFIDRYLPEFNVGYVTSDNIKGGFLATKHLLEHGHTSIAIIEELNATSTRDREEGYRRALSEFGININEALIIREDKNNAEAGYEGMKQLLQSRQPLTAVFCSNDFVAKGVYTYLKERGISIPDEISVIGFDDDEEIATLLNPPLTTVVQSNYEMGVKAAKMLIRAVKKKSIEPVKEILEVKLVERSSVKRIKSGYKVSSA